MPDKNNDAKKGIARFLDNIKKRIDDTEEALEEAGIEKKQLDESGLEQLRSSIAELVPGVEVETIDAIIQLVADVIMMPEEVEEEEMIETAMDEEEEKSDEIKALIEKVTALASDYTGVYADMHELTKIMDDAFEKVSAHNKSYSDFDERLAKLEKEISGKSRRASQAQETEVDPKSKIAERIKLYDTSDVPSAFADMYKGGKNG